MDRVFSASAMLGFPFWVAMIVAPRWRVTRRVLASPLVVLGSVLLYASLVLPALGTVLPVVARPTLATVMALLNQPVAATAAWAHFLAFDLFVGRWIYLDALERKVPLPWLAVAPTLVLTLLLGPLGLGAYLLLRTVNWSRLGGATRALWAASGPLTSIGLASLGLLLASLVLQEVDHRAVLGVSTWVKPAKFAASVAAAAFTLAWMLGQFDAPSRGLRRAAAVMSGMAALELAIITVQAARGVPSHFNARTALDALAFAVMGAGITIFWLAQGYLFVRALRHRFADGAVGWGIRLGLGIALAGGAVAFLMTRPTPAQLDTLKAGRPSPAVGAHAVGVPDGGAGLPVTRWSTEGGDLRVPHFIGLHALQLVPLAGVMFARRRRRAVERGADPQQATARANTLTIAVGASTFGLVVVTLVQALRAQPLLAPDGATLFLAVLAMAPLAIVSATLSLMARPLAKKPELVLRDFAR
ncbi:MAG TPA: ABA4-like family protein [Polyangia bacterium]|nr:ABA4-like family protein [Polyangia bacterium]